MDTIVITIREQLSCPDTDEKVFVTPDKRKIFRLKNQIYRDTLWKTIGHSRMTSPLMSVLS